MITIIYVIEEILGDELTPYYTKIYGGPTRSLQRFLEAEDNNPEKAADKYRKALLFFENFPLERNNEVTEEEKEKYKIFLSMWPIKFVGYTKAGNLLLYTKLQDIQPKKFVKELGEDRIKKYFALYGGESLILQNFGNREIKPQDETAWAQTVEIFDLKNISLSQLHISGLRVLARVLKIGQDVFPDTLEKSYIINAPWFFAAAWKIIKLGLNARTIARVTISRGNCKTEIAKHVNSEDFVDKMFEGAGKVTFELPKLSDIEE